MDLIDAMTNRNIRSVREKSSLNRRMCIRFESRKICVAGNQCDNNDFDFHNAEHKELPVIAYVAYDWCISILSSKKCQTPIILADLLGNKSLLQRVQKVIVCDL